ncbi:MAG TPA: hypothetical protein VMH28_27965 [Candidatus Acidoferrales bacterium]|nr:hypothetical protein [Candidatus Acidoferrales bacterium]
MNDHDDAEILRRIRPTGRIAASNSFRERAMKQIVEESVREEERRLRWTGWPRWITAGCAAGLLLLLLPVLHIGGPPRSPGAALFAQTVQALSNIRTVHIVGRIRTLPRDNFELIGTRYEFVPIEIWREYSNPPRWRVEKPGRVVVMNGQNSLLYLPDSNEASAGGPNAGFIDWLRPMLDPTSILEKELVAARQGSAQAAVSESKGVITAVLRRQAQGNFENDWARNKSVAESDHTCVYRFDSASKRLESVQVTVSAGGAETVVAEFTGFRYDEPFPDSLFALQLPAGVDWMNGPASASAPAAVNGPRDAAVYFFQACAREDWDSVLQVSPRTTVPEAVKLTYGGLQVISIGEAFQSGLYGGYFVPYRVRLRDGYLKTHKLAVRNDNPEHRWVLDGGY